MKFFLILLLLPICVQASKQSLTFDSVLSSLRLQSVERLNLYSQNETRAMQLLEQIAFSKEQAMPVRWNAVVSLAQIGRKEVAPLMRKASRQEEWFMRNAALVALSEISREDAIEIARKLLRNDPALVVRSAAVDVLSKLGSVENVDALWGALYDKHNWRGNQSLWIRKSIATTLAEFSLKGQEKKWVELLADKDTSLHPIAITALESTTGQVFGKSNDSVLLKRAQWQKWWQKKVTL